MVAQGTVASGDERLPLLPGIQLEHSSLLFAVQELGGVSSALPFGAWGMDGSPKLARNTAGNLLPLPPIPYLDSMRWMNWSLNPR